MEQAGSAGGDQRSGPGVGGGGRAKASLCGACGLGLVSRALGRLRDPPWGYYGPGARCSLTARVISGHASAARSWAKAERRLLEPLVERREASAFRKTTAAPLHTPAPVRRGR